MTIFTQQLQVFFNQLEQLNPSQKNKEPTQLNIPNYNNLANFFTNFKDAYKPLNQLKKTGFYVNVWKTAGLKRDEVRNNQVLKWFLDCKADHGLENTVLEILLNTLPIELKAPQKYSSYAENYPISDGKNRVDIEIESDELLLFIEIKIDANEGIDQLKDIKKLLK